MRFTWLQKLIHVVAVRKHTPRTSSRRSRRLHCLPCLEILETRLTPAIDITIQATGIGTLDHLLSATNGTITTSDDPGVTNATLSMAALQSVGAGVEIEIDATDNITFQNVGTLKLKTGHGVNAIFAADTGAMNFDQTSNNVTTQGGSLFFVAGGDVSVSNLNSNGGNVFLAAGVDGAGNLQVQNVLAGATGVLTLEANNAAGGNITQAGSASTASALTINATATNDISLNSIVGTTVNITSTGGSVSSTGAQPIHARSQLNISAVTGITINAQAVGLSALNSGSGDINITQVATPAQPLTINGSGIVDQASSGTVSVYNLGAGINLSGNGVLTDDGAVTLSATSFQIGAQVNSGNAITNLMNSTAGRQINVGTPVPGTINLTQAGLDDITASTLRIGTPTAGAITISAPIASPIGWNTLSLNNNAAITETAAGSLIVPNLRVSSSGAVNFSGVNDVGILAMDTNGGALFNDGPHQLAVGTVDGVAGISTNESEIHLIADGMNITQPVTTGSASSSVVLLEPFTKNRSIDIGGNASGQFGLTGAELNEITAGVLRIGNTLDTGNLAITSTISDLTAGWGVLDLINGGSISENGGSLIVSDLAAQAAKGVTLNSAANAVTELAGTTASQPFSFTDSTSMSISMVDGVNEIVAGKGNVTLNVTGTLSSGSTAKQNDVVASGATVNATAGIGDYAQSLKLLVGFLTADSTSGNIFLAESGTATLAGSGLNAGSGIINLTKGAFDLSSNGQIAAASSVRLNGSVLNLETYSDTIDALTLTSTSTLAAQINSLVAGHYGSLTVNGAINLGSAHLSLILGAQFTTPLTGTVLTLLSNPSNSAVAGQFTGLPNNSTIMVGSHHFRLSYTGGGFDVILTYLG
jgi:hypothetical protein